ncbi:MAG: XrtA system polysaccharide deacetylase [Candidatus Omnitrophota bacterium]
MIKNALTFDVEEYFQVSNFSKAIKRKEWEKIPSRLSVGLNKILGILAEHKVKATFFVLGWAAERHPELIKRIALNGHEIASHGYDHQLIYNQSKEEFTKDLEKSLSIIRAISKEKVLGFRAPSFSIVKKSYWALKILAQHGIRYDASIFPIMHHRYGIEDSYRFPYEIKANGDSIIEFPCSTTRFLGKNVPFSGGGYLRLLPYAVIKHFIAQLNRRQKPAIVYIHPWELDPGQPRINAGALNHWRHYQGLGTTEPKLRRLLSDFKFTTVKEVLGL